MSTRLKKRMNVIPARMVIRNPTQLRTVGMKTKVAETFALASGPKLVTDHVSLPNPVKTKISLREVNY